MTDIQQQAKVLVKQFYQPIFDIDNGVNVMQDKVRYDAAKQCALIHIDGLIVQNGELYLNGLDGKYYREKNCYLFELKQAINEI